MKYQKDMKSDIFSLFDKEKDFHVSCIGPKKGPHTYNIYIFDEIESPGQFIPAIEALQVAGEEDVVVVHLQTPGGNVDAMDTFLFALETTSAGRVIFEATGGVHSAGSIILMAANEIVFSDNFNSLVHNGQLGYGGKTSDFERAVRFMLEQDKRLLRKYYKFFLSDDEIEAMINGRDFWFDRDEFLARLEQRNVKLMELMAISEE